MLQQANWFMKKAINLKPGPEKSLSGVFITPGLIAREQVFMVPTVGGICPQ